MKESVGRVILSPSLSGRKIFAVAFWGSLAHHELRGCFAALSMTGFGLLKVEQSKGGNVRD
jgi:hypothetical protein